MSYSELILLPLGFLAGFIDSIAGGGGLISIPSLSLFMGLSPETVGTNKIAASIAAFIALLIYSRKGHLKIKESLYFSAWIMLGAFIGSSLNPLVPTYVFKIFLLITIPLVLWFIFNKKYWLPKQGPNIANTDLSFFHFGLMFSGLANGIYDGMWGPGGGTFMLISLLYVLKLPLLPAIAISKFANTSSALMSLANYQYQGLVKWELGKYLGLGIGIGALVGASLASNKAEKIVRPVLFVVSMSLLIKTFFFS